jgi:outer membrane protein OmpA-like peptidoglycan-associated protein
MTILQRITIVMAIAASTAVFAAVDNNPMSAGTSNGRNIVGIPPEAPFENPALLGCDRVPYGGVSLFPFGVAVWSDKLAISPFTFLSNMPTDSIKQKALIKTILKNSFDVAEGTDSLTALSNSQKIMDVLKGGTSIYAGSRISLISFAHKRYAFNITTHADEQITIPDAPFYAIFGGNVGLTRGNKLDFSSFSQQGIWATDFTFSLGLPVTIPALHDFFKLSKGAGGVGIKYVMGHSMLKASARSNSTLAFDSINNVIKMDGQFDVETAGMGLHGPLTMDGPFKGGFPINGHGLGVDVGGILYDEKGSMSINIQNLGVLFWTNNVKSHTYNFKKDNLTLYDIISGIDAHGHNHDSIVTSIFNRNEAYPVNADTLNNTSSAVTFLPLALNIGYSRQWDFTKSTNSALRNFADFANAAANYQQYLVPGPGLSYIPRLSIGGELGTLHNFLPLRAGFIMGGPEHWASGFGFGLNFKYVSLQTAYKAIGNWWFVPSHGFELAGALNFNWGMHLPVQAPKEYDIDHDGIPDSVDKCPTIPEDKDSFQDEDGCPDYDNDNDGIPDSLDKCPNVPEDKDNFQDQDGCPDYDNDADGVPDSVDKCPLIPEDIDGFEDQDGCPDYDNDHDGIPDTLDKCPNDPETFNGYKDDDGCPDTVVMPTAKEVQVLNTKLRDINFKTASAELLPASYAALDFIVSFLHQYPNLRYEIQGHTDNRGEADYNLLLSAARAGTVRAYLLQKGVGDSSLIAIGYGLTMPIADNKTAAGRALNRRVEFKYIETPQDYASLKQRESEFREKIRAAKINGAQY